MNTTEIATDSVAVNDQSTQTFVERLATNVGHLPIGRAWIRTGFIYLLLSAVIGLLIGVERISLSGSELFSDGDQFFQFWSLYRVGIVLLGVVPIILGIATCIVPLQIGANTIVFPRAAAFGFWIWFLGSGITLFGFLADGGFGAPELGSQQEAVALTLVGFLLVIGGICVSTVTVLTTIVTGRTLGMTLRRIPLFSWTMMVAGTLWIATLPVLAANSILSYVDLRGRSAIYFGLEDMIWEQLSWAFSNPQLYVFVLPLIGIAYDIIPVAVKVRQKNHEALLVATGLFGAVSFGAYVQPFFDTPGTPVVEEALYVLTAFLAIPVMLFILGGLLDTLRQGAKNLTNHPPAPMLLAFLSVLLLLIGTVLGAMRAIEPFELVSTSSITAQMTFTIGAALASVIAAMLWWGDRITGKSGTQGIVLLAGILVVVGVILSGLSDAISGFLGLNEFVGVNLVTAGSPNSVVQVFNTASAFGALLILGGLLLCLIVGIRRFRGPESKIDPWGGHTLEWTEDKIEVHSERPLLDISEKVGL